MAFDTFRADVEPGGLVTAEEIQVLICYILYKTDTPLTLENFSTILRRDALANYFDIVQAVHMLNKDKNIEKNDIGEYTLTENGKTIARELKSNVPYSVREKAMDAANNLILIAQRKKENNITIEPVEKGYVVHISMRENDEEFMGISVRVSNLTDANRVKENFLKNPSEVYLNNLRMLLGYDISKN